MSASAAGVYGDAAVNTVTRSVHGLVHDHRPLQPRGLDASDAPLLLAAETSQRDEPASIRIVPFRTIIAALIVGTADLSIDGDTRALRRRHTRHIKSTASAVGRCFTTFQTLWTACL